MKWWNPRKLGSTTINCDSVAEAWIEATVIRADGTIEELGVVSRYKRPWWRTLRFKFGRKPS